MTDLITWLRAQLDAEERIAREPTAPNWHYSPPLGGDGYLDFEGSFEVGEQEVETRGFDPDDLAHIADHDPARVLRQVQAHRAILDDYAHAMGRRKQHPDDMASAGALLALHGVVKRLTSIYSDRDGYRADWST